MGIKHLEIYMEPTTVSIFPLLTARESVSQRLQPQRNQVLVNSSVQIDQRKLGI